MARRGSGRFTVRAASAVVTFWLGIAVLVVVVATPIVNADARVFAFTLGPALLLAWILWIALYRPAVHYDDARAVVVNIGRRYVLPWGHVTDVRQGIALRFDLDAGKPVMAFGVPAPRRRGIVAGVVDRRTRPADDVNREADLLDGVRRSAAPSDEPVVASWEVVPLVVGAVLLVAVVVEVLIGV